MKKSLLILSLFLSSYYITNAQCKTCHAGTHDPNDPTVNTHLVGGKVTPNGNGSLGQSYILQNVCGLNYTTASVMTTTRYTHPGTGFPTTMSVTGLPVVASCMNVQKAFLYWGASYTEASAPATSANVTNPLGGNGIIPATLVGTNGPVCWGETGTATYRADITALISGNGSYKINLTGFNNADYEVDGCTMVVIYTTPNTYSGSISIWDGDISAVGGTLTQTLSGFSVCAASTVASAFGVYGDMQDNISPDSNTEKFNGTTKTYYNNFWNTNVMNTTVSTGLSSTTYNSYTNNGGDCFFWSVAGLYWQNTTCVTCIVTTLHLTTTQVNPTCGNNNGSATVGVTGGTLPYTYSWSPVGGTGPTASGLSVGVYVVTVTDSTGCNKATDTVTLVNPTAPTLTMTSSPDKCNGDKTGTATVTATGGTPAYTYAWSPGGQTTSSITGLSTGSYTVLVTDSKGCQSTKFVNINQPNKLVVDIDSIHGIPCLGGNFGAIYEHGSGGTPAYTYSWAPGGQTTNNITGLSMGTYTVSITDGNGCHTDTMLNVTIPPTMTLSVTSFDAYCGANGFAYISNLTGGTPPYTYLWTNGNNTTFNFGLTQGTYCVTVTDAKGCKDSACTTVGNISSFTMTINPIVNVSCFGGNTGSATCNVTGTTSPYTYSWTPTGQTTSVATGLSAGTYTITVTDNSSCQNSDVVTITQPPPLVLTSTQDYMICIGQSQVLTATALGGTPAYTYTWNATTTATSYTVSPTTTTVYTVQATDANGCLSNKVTDTVKVRPPLGVTVTPLTASFCAGGSTTFTAKATGGDSVYTYTWMPGNLSGPSVTVTATTTTTYTVTVKDNCGTPSDSATAIITIDPAPLVGFEVDSTSGCYPLCVSFKDTSTVSGGTIAKWAWNFGDSAKDTVQNPKHCYSNPGQYTVSLTATSNNGCVSSLTVANMITVYPHPIASFILGPQPTTIMAPTIYFTDESTDPNPIVKWSWDFKDIPDSGNSTQQNPHHSYNDTGTFCPWLTVTDIHGCTDSTSNCLFIEPQFTLYIPDAFTPNNDGLNDVFEPKGEALKSFNMYIFDRWGLMLYHTDDLFKGWDGTYGGKVCQTDTYVYLIDILDNNSEKHSYIGKVTLIR
jgi:gliding motility-associated-like protein